ncbi:MAG TPA: ribokinase [Bacteroidota bacterium]|nr:ribokinase [Bacteroidota bacterium]
MDKSIVVIGSSNVDFIMKMSRLPKIGETVTDATFMQVFGGKGANQAVAAARAGGNVSFVNCVGDDPITPAMLAQYRRDGINTDFVFRESGVPSGAALVMIGEQGSNYLSVAPGANYRLTPAHIDRAADLIKGAEIVVMQYEILPETLEHALELCARFGKQVMWNCAPAREFDRAYLKNVTILVVNENEAAALSGVAVLDEVSARKAARTLAGFGCSCVVLTLGASGSIIHSPAGERSVPAFNVEAVDTTAAGDVYCGSLAVAIVEGRSIVESARFASAAAALSVTRLGAQPSAPTRKEIDSFLRSQLPA